MMRGRILPRLIGLPTLVSLLFLAVGCGDSGGSGNSVTGTVTMKGSPVAGVVTFAGKGKEVSAPVGPDGTYTLNDPPLGQVTITVKGFPGMVGGTGPLVAPPTDKKMELPGGTAKAGGVSGVAPPAKYATAAGGLSYEVKAGKQKHNIELTP